MPEKETLTLGESEYRFAEIVWEAEPIGSGQLVKLAQQRFGWKKSTSYTVLKNLVEKGVLQNENSTVTALITKERIQAYESATIVNRTFDGSLPRFVAAFVAQHPLSAQDATEICAMLASCAEQEEQTIG